MHKSVEAVLVVGDHRRVARVVDHIVEVKFRLLFGFRHGYCGLLNLLWVLLFWLLFWLDGRLIGLNRDFGGFGWLLD